MALKVWDWMVWVMDKADKILKEQKAKWYQKNKSDPAFREKRQEAVDRYRERKMEEDPEGFRKYRREIQNKSQQKYAARKRAEMTPEELAAFKAKEAERIRKYRAKKKAEKLAMQERGKSNE